MSMLFLSFAPCTSAADTAIEDMPYSFDSPDLERMTAALKATTSDGQKSVHGVLADCILSDDRLVPIAQRTANAKRFADKCRTSYDEAKSEFGTAENAFLFDYVKDIEETALYLVKRAQSGPVDSDAVMVLSAISVMQRMKIGRLRQLMDKIGVQ